MPIIKSAKKKMLQDRKRTAHNMELKTNIKGLIKGLRRAPSEEALKQVASALDKAVKTKFIHPNKAARLKSRLSKITEPVGSVKKAVKKKAPVRKVSKKLK